MFEFRKYTPLLLKRSSIILIVLTIFLLVSVFAFKNILFIALLLGLVSISKLPEIVYRSINTDMTMFVLILLGRVYGLQFGLVVALAGFYTALAVKTAIARHVAAEKFFIPPIGYIVASTIVLSMGYGIFATGMIAIAIYASMLTVAYGFIYGFQLFDMALYLATILPFNYFLFSNFAPAALAILS